MSTLFPILPIKKMHLALLRQIEELTVLQLGNFAPIRCASPVVMHQIASPIGHPTAVADGSLFCLYKREMIWNDDPRAWADGGEIYEQTRALCGHHIGSRVPSNWQSSTQGGRSVTR